MDGPRRLQPESQNQLNAHVFADRSDNTSWPGNVNYVQQALFSDVTQFTVNDTHILRPTLINEATFSRLVSRSGGGATSQILPRDLGINVDSGPDGRGMSFSVSGSINLPIPASTRRTMQLAVQEHDHLQRGNHTLKFGYEFIRPVFDFNLSLTRSANFQGTRTGNPTADFMMGTFENSTIEFGMADHSPCTVKHSLHRDSYRI